MEYLLDKNPGFINLTVRRKRRDCGRERRKSREEEERGNHPRPSDFRRKTKLFTMMNKTLPSLAHLPLPTLCSEVTA